MALAQASDVAARLVGETTPATPEQITFLLDYAELKLRVRITNLIERAATDDLFKQLVINTEAEMVARVIRNPAGYRSEGEGSYNYSLDTRVAAGFLFVRDDEWSDLGVGTGAFSIAPYIRPAPAVPRPEYRPYGRY